MKKPDLLYLHSRLIYYDHVAQCCDDFKQFLPGQTEPVTVTISLGSKRIMEAIIELPAGNEFAAALVGGLGNYARTNAIAMQNELNTPGND